MGAAWSVLPGTTSPLNRLEVIDRAKERQSISSGTAESNGGRAAMMGRELPRGLGDPQTSSSCVGLTAQPVPSSASWSCCARRDFLADTALAVRRRTTRALPAARRCRQSAAGAPAARRRACTHCLGDQGYRACSSQCLAAYCVRGNFFRPSLLMFPSRCNRILRHTFATKV